MSDEGWVKVYRKVQNNPLWTTEPFTRGQAWIDLILLANHKDGYIYVRDHKIQVKRGQVGWSENRLSQRWKWSRTKVRKFLNDLEKEQQLKQEKSKSYSLLTLINYNDYQSKEQQENNSSTTERQQEDTNKNEKNVKKYYVGCDFLWNGDDHIDYVSFVDRFNDLYGTSLRITDKKREQIRARLRDYTGAEIVTAWENRLKDDWLNGEGQKHLTDWNAAMRNSEKIDRYLNVQPEKKPQYIDEGVF